MSKKVYIGMSGGVDSSVAAYLLKEKGYEVTGVTLALFEEDKDARAVAKHLGINHLVIDMKEEFKEQVIGNFLKEYKNCRTPNPCIVCNKTMKWKALLQKIKSMGGDYLATGHYSDIVETKEGRFSIRVPSDFSKDQTYVLYTLSQEELSHTLFPLSGYSKEEVRGIAKKIGLTVSEKKDSMDICFIPDGDYTRFLEQNCDLSDMGPGEFVDARGNVLGEHKGLYRYTIGQRKNLGIALGERMYVSALLPDSNRVVLVRDEELYTDTLFADNISYMGEKSFDSDKIYLGRIRYSHKGTPCQVTVTEGGIKVVFKEPVRAVTPGQSLVLYYEDYVAGGGIITGGIR